MSASTELNVAKKNLSEVLGEGMKLYLEVLKSWFKQKISRAEFDQEARKLLPSESVHLHNQFLLAVLTKCQTTAVSLASREHKPSNTTTPSSISKIKNKKQRLYIEKGASHAGGQRFLSANPLARVPQIQSHIPEPEERGPGYVAREMLIPDIGLIHGRMIVSAWDFGMDDVEENAVKLLMLAVEAQLKNVLTAVLSRRNAYQLREERFKFGMGSECPQTQLRNSALVARDSLFSEATSISARGIHMPTVRPSLETGYRDAAVQICSAGTTPRTRNAVTLYDLYDALQVHKSALPSHAVYAMAMERIINRLWHPSSEELEQEAIHKQQVRIKQALHAQQAVFRI